MRLTLSGISVEVFSELPKKPFSELEARVLTLELAGCTPGDALLDALREEKAGAVEPERQLQIRLSGLLTGCATDAGERFDLDQLLRGLRDRDVRVELPFVEEASVVLFAREPLAARAEGLREEDAGDAGDGGEEGFHGRVRSGEEAPKIDVEGTIEAHWAEALGLYLRERADDFSEWLQDYDGVDAGEADDRVQLVIEQVESALDS